MQAKAKTSIVLDCSVAKSQSVPPPHGHLMLCLPWSSYAYDHGHAVPTMVILCLRSWSCCAYHGHLMPTIMFILCLPWSSYAYYHGYAVPTIFGQVKQVGFHGRAECGNPCKWLVAAATEKASFDTASWPSSGPQRPRVPTAKPGAVCAGLCTTGQARCHQATSAMLATRRRCCNRRGSCFALADCRCAH